MPTAVNREFHRDHGHRYEAEMVDASGAPIRDRNIARPGEGVRRPFALMDAARLDTATRDAVVRAKLGTAADGKSDAFMDAAYRTLTGTAPAAAPIAIRTGLTDAQRVISQQGIVAALADHARRAGTAVADARRDARAEYAASLASGWATNDSTRAASRNEALRHDAARRPLPVADAGRTVDVRRGAYDGLCASLQDAWKGAV